jgi:hypothetical protein
VIDHEVDFLQIGGKILQPQGCPLAHSHRLRRLVVGIPCLELGLDRRFYQRIEGQFASLGIAGT